MKVDFDPGYLRLLVLVDAIAHYLVVFAEVDALFCHCLARQRFCIDLLYRTMLIGARSLLRMDFRKVILPKFTCVIVLVFFVDHAVYIEGDC